MLTATVVMRHDADSRYFTGRFEDDEVLVTHLYFCHDGVFPSKNSSLRDSNQTTSVELNVTLDGEVRQCGCVRAMIFCFVRVHQIIRQRTCGRVFHACCSLFSLFVSLTGRCG